MQYRKIGNSGLRVSRLVLGTLNVGSHEQFAPLGGLDQPTAQRLIEIAMDAGVNMIDTADLYSHGQAEEIVGASLKGRRDDVLIATKARFPSGAGPNDAGSSRFHLTRAVEASLRRLGTDHIDLLYLHQWDGETPLEETLQTLDQLVRDGKVRYTGVSNFSGWQVAKTAAVARAHNLIPPIAQQVYYTPEAREAEYEIIPAAVDSGLGTLVWSPLGQSLLSGKVRRGRPVPPTTRQGTDWPEPYVTDRERAFDIIDVLVCVAEDRGVSVPQVVLSWLLNRPGITGAVFGARNEDQLRDDLAAVDLVLTEDETRQIDEVTQPAVQYPFWHRAMLATDRPDRGEAPYLDGYASTIARS
ncbi:aldo/keto reductase [Pseudonocardia alaniniphila]|uniref:Aldo/keto reductase n=1 Tax=Pseudonocardia alaniniphila TaxID=75291 RepID=A0ABS9TT32_9PSEU|nr:aldo/keto reductase [Pseudonocardia alaniniphila]MCH6171720.1 aldo/keto reductase [Pseudonocardia alaniniphila]